MLIRGIFIRPLCMMEGRKRVFPFRALQSGFLALLLLLLIYYFAYHVRPNKPSVFKGSQLLNLSHYHYIQIKDKEDNSNRFLRIIHISDTHGIHNDLLNQAPYIPDGDILIHTGDFGQYRESRNQEAEEYIHPIQEYFQTLPHKYKIYLPGNHDYSLENLPTRHVQKLLYSAVYLHDKPLVIEGIKFYGTGWNRARRISKAQAFAVPEDKINIYWDEIPTDTDILASHSPPYGILDQDVEGGLPAVMNCTPEIPCGHLHMGSMALRDAVTHRIRPRLHLFGHSHFGNGWTLHDGIVFCNSALEAHKKLSVIDYYYTKEVNK